MHKGVSFSPETITSTTEILHIVLSASGTPASNLNMIPSCGSPGDLVSCLVAVEKLPDDPLSKQVLLIEFKRVVSCEEKPVHCFLLQLDSINNITYIFDSPIVRFLDVGIQTSPAVSPSVCESLVPYGLNMTLGVLKGAQLLLCRYQWKSAIIHFWDTQNFPNSTCESEIGIVCHPSSSWSSRKISTDCHTYARESRFAACLGTLASLIVTDILSSSSTWPSASVFACLRVRAQAVKTPNDSMEPLAPRLQSLTCLTIHNFLI